MTTDAQVRKLRQFLGEGHPLYRAVLKVGMDAKSARKYRHADRLPSESFTPGTWRTREDPFQDVWPQLRDLLEINPGLQAKTLFGDLQRRFPGGEWDMLSSWFTPWIFDTPFERAVGFGQSRGYNS
jgi:hypothetical protein